MGCGNNAYCTWKSKIFIWRISKKLKTERKFQVGVRFWISKFRDIRARVSVCGGKGENMRRNS